MMHREAVFNRAGSYAFVLESNALAHREALDVARRVVARWMAGRERSGPLRVLDLACGGAPVTIAGVMAGFPASTFDYTGIDINADQVERTARHFAFPKNVARVRVVEGNAWTPTRLVAEDRFDLIYTGLNFHHATPEELSSLGYELQGILAADGILLNHDFYRPNAIASLRRPERADVPGVGGAALVDTVRLDALAMPDPGRGEGLAAPDHDWRDDFLRDYSRYLRAHGLAEAGIAETREHVLRCDYPVSTDECRRLFEQAGFAVTVEGLAATGHPMGRYLAVVWAQLAAARRTG
jgi:SAM-dependent methyltransferase